MCDLHHVLSPSAASAPAARTTFQTPGLTMWVRLLCVWPVWRSSSIAMGFDFDGSKGWRPSLRPSKVHLHLILSSRSSLSLLQCWNVPFFFKAHETSLPTEGALDSQREALLWRVTVTERLWHTLLQYLEGNSGCMQYHLNFETLPATDWQDSFTPQHLCEGAGFTPILQVGKLKSRNQW